MAKLFKNQEDLLVEFSQFLPDANGGNSNSSISINSASINSSTSSSSLKISTQLQNQSNNNELNVFASFQNQNFQNSQLNSLQNSILNVPIPTVLTSLTTPSNTTTTTAVNISDGGPSSTASSSTSSAAKSGSSNLVSSSTPSSSNSKQPAPQQKSSIQPAASASPSAVSTSSSTSSVGSANTKNKFASENIQTQQSLSLQQQQQQQQQQPMATINQNSLQCKTNANSGSNSNLTSSVKRSSNYQQISNKKQKLNAISNPSNVTTNTSIGNLKTHANFKSTDSTDMSLNRFNGNINEITFFERLKKALRTQQVYDNFLKCLALFNQDIVTHTELIQLVEPFLGKFANLFKWFKEYVETKSIVSINQDSSETLPKQTQNDLNLKMSSQMNSNKNRIFMPPGNHYSLEIDYLSCKQYGASYRDISSYPQPISSGQSDLCKQVNFFFLEVFFFTRDYILFI